ncbi:predicted protein [Plenodomus lingam JN3]|uniref:Predicted protein n=1 Tax=Leptosphaeria maculans (strain JN3 / isolate v23.1.3 / race Av1-4-5-6-7-8) TaxID=985895 RepID=E4ZP55_LEPMJ|nr:predicted protein [Plenodomus lingam JN3]CBX93584.1 predicted protein [Plenodomus lingam JN3]
MTYSSDTIDVGRFLVPFARPASALHYRVSSATLLAMLPLQQRPTIIRIGFYLLYPSLNISDLFMELGKHMSRGSTAGCHSQGNTTRYGTQPGRTMEATSGRTNVVNGTMIFHSGPRQNHMAPTTLRVYLFFGCTTYHAAEAPHAKLVPVPITPSIAEPNSSNANSSP